MSIGLADRHVPFPRPAGARRRTPPSGDDLRLRRDGLVCAVTVEGRHEDLSAARHVRSTLRPATDAELAGPLDLPTRR
ncbi:hypothetical protein ACWGI0_06495 [Streptomyces sp. NPDC054802]